MSSGPPAKSKKILNNERGVFQESEKLSIFSQQ